MSSGHGGRRDNRKKSKEDGRGGLRTPSPGKKIGRLRRKYTLSKDAALALRLIAWNEHHRPTTDEEEERMLSELVLTVSAQLAADPREGYDIDF